MEKRVLVLLIILASIIILGIFLFSFNKSSEQTNQGVLNVEVVPLSQEERQKVFDSTMSTEFIKDIPEKYPILITFFSFDGNGNRVYHDSFLIGKNEFLSEGEPEIYLAIHAKYISELTPDNFCEVIQRANKAGDLAFDSESNKASLLIKYRSMLKHRDCFGF